MKGLLIPIAALLSAALISLAPAKAERSDIKNIVPKTANVEQARKSATQEVAPLQEKTPEPPKNLSEPVVKAPEPVKAPVPEPQKKQGCETYRSLVSKYDWDANVALAVMQAESGCNPSGPPSSTCDRGLMQINCVHIDMVNSLDDLYDPATNISVAYKVYLGRKQKTGNGWLAWNAYKDGKHLRFL